VRQLAAILAREFERLPDSINLSYKRKLSLSAICNDGSSFESNGIELFSDNSIVTKKSISSISLIFSYYPTDSKIEISLEHAASQNWNFVCIRGTDSKWVNGTIKEIEETIESFAPQTSFILRHKRWVKIVLALGIGQIFIYLLRFLLLASSDPTPTSPSRFWNRVDIFIHNYPFIKYIIKYLFIYILGYSPALVVYDKIQALWPSVELQIGPEHSFVEQQRRQAFMSVVVLGIIPLCVNWIYDIVKALF
jgi:hypothetical protein